MNIEHIITLEVSVPNAWSLLCTPVQFLMSIAPYLKTPMKFINYPSNINQWKKAITSTMRTPGIIGLSGKWPGKKLSFIVTFLMATTETPGLYSMTLSTKRKGNLNHNQKEKHLYLQTFHKLPLDPKRNNI
jgi:hypothetical protein